MESTLRMSVTMPSSFARFLGRGVHGILLCQAETAGAVRAFVESCRYPHNTIGVDPTIPPPMERMEGAIRAKDGGTDSAGRKLLGIGTRGRGSESTAAPIWGLSIEDYMECCDPQAEWRVVTRGKAGKPRRRRQLRVYPRGAGAGICRDRPRRPQSFARLSDDSTRTLPGGNADGARSRAGGLPQERRRFPAILHGGQRDRPDRRGCARDRRA